MNFFNKMTLRNKMILGFSLSILFMLAALAVSLTGLRINNKEFTEMAAITQEANLASRIDATLNDSLIAFNAYVSNETPEANSSFKMLTQEMTTDIQFFEEISQSNDRLDYIASVSSGMDSYNTQFDDYSSLNETRMSFYDNASQMGADMITLLKDLKDASLESNDVLIYAQAVNCERALLASRLHAMKFFTFHESLDYQNYQMAFTEYKRTLIELKKLTQGDVMTSDTLEKLASDYETSMAKIKDAVLELDTIAYDIQLLEKEMTTYLDMINKSVLMEQDALTRHIHEQSNRLTSISIGVAIVSVLLIILISYKILKVVLIPMRSLKNTFDSISSGDVDFDFRLPVETHDIIGEMSQAFNTFMVKLETIMMDIAYQNKLKTAENHLHILIRDHDNFEHLLEEALHYFCTLIEAPIGALYTQKGERTLQMTASYAYSGDDTYIEYGQGLVGQCFKDQKTKILTDIPTDYFEISSGTGATQPSVLALLPCKHGDELEAIFELGLLVAPTKTQLDLMNALATAFAQSLHAARLNDEMKILLEKTMAQSEELQMQQEELRQSNEELEEQTRALKDSEQRLEVQQEELRVSNEELEQRSFELIEQKKSVDEMNAELLIKQTEIIEKAEALELANKYKSEFLANMSHELRTPLNSVLVLSQLLMDRKNMGPLDEKEIEFVKTINASGADLLKLINDILDLSKVEAGKMDLSFETIVLEELLVDSVRMFGPMAEIKGIQYKTDIEKNLARTIESDTIKLNQILKNLISNALKFTETGHVTLSIRKPSEIECDALGASSESYIAFEVSDTGIGIHEEKQQLIFDAFRQADGTTSRKYGGTGLGLTITRDLTSLLGGEIFVESTVGEGSKFVLLLPKDSHDSPNENDTKTQVDTEEVKDTNAVPFSALVVGNLVEYRDTIKTIASDKDFNCHFEKDVDRALSLIKQLKPSAIILEDGIEDTSGKDIASYLERTPSTKHIPLITLTPEVNIQKEPSNIIGYLNDPIEVKTIYKTMASIEAVTTENRKNILVVGPCGGESFDAFKNFASVLKVLTVSEALKQLNSDTITTIILDFAFNDKSIKEKIINDYGHIPTIIYSTKPLEKNDIYDLIDPSLYPYLKSNIDGYVEDELSLFFHGIQSALKNVHLESSAQRQFYMDDLKRRVTRDPIFENKRVLIVDDDERNVFALTSLLKKHGMTPLIAKNGEESIHFVRDDETIDLILMDIMMPKLDGYQAIESIRALENGKDTPIIVLTAKAMRETRNRCLEAGASDYLTKPLDTEKLISLLRVWIV